MTTAKRKTRKLRGSRCHGWGRSGQHRDSGMLGGHGNAGWKRHKWSAVIRYNLEMGSRGFHPVRQKTTNAINVNDLVLQLDRLIEEGSAKQAGLITTGQVYRAIPTPDQNPPRSQITPERSRLHREADLDSSHPSCLSDNGGDAHLRHHPHREH